MISKGKTALVEVIKLHGSMRLILKFGIKWIKETASRHGRFNPEE
jgi:hypothetical protein